MKDGALVPPGPCIVKLGGSLHGAAELAAWLTLLATAPGPPRILVPGGGPFADAVRAAQARLGFPDLAAHRMAILAMQQFGLLLQALEPRLRLVETEAELAGGETGIWLPWRLAGLEPGLPASWDLTSDSLALWLATRLRAQRLLLVKSTSLPAGTTTAEALATAGILDPLFPTLLPAFTGETACAGRQEAERAGRFLAGQDSGLLRVVAARGPRHLRPEPTAPPGGPCP